MSGPETLRGLARRTDEPSDEPSDEPEPLDSWERLEEDFGMREVEYCGQHGLLDPACEAAEGDGPTRHCATCACACGERMERDLVRRAKALAERELEGSTTSRFGDGPASGRGGRVTADYARLRIGFLRTRLDAAMRCVSVPRPDWEALRDEMDGLVVRASELAARCDAMAGDAGAAEGCQDCQRPANVDPAAASDDLTRAQLSQHFPATWRCLAHEKN